jgi:hypothetical protein
VIGRDGQGSYDFEEEKVEITPQHQQEQQQYLRQ